MYKLENRNFISWGFSLLSFAISSARFCICLYRSYCIIGNNFKVLGSSIIFTTTLHWQSSSMCTFYGLISCINIIVCTVLFLIPINDKWLYCALSFTYTVVLVIRKYKEYHRFHILVLFEVMSNQCIHP